MSKEENVFVGTNCQSFDPSKVQCDKEGNMPIHILDKYCEENDTRYNIFPLTIIQAVFDGLTGTRLDRILAACNSVYLTWEGTFADTVNKLDKIYRRKGYIITYRDATNINWTQRYNSDDISDAAWTNPDNWEGWSFDTVIKDLAEALEEIFTNIGDYKDFLDIITSFINDFVINVFNENRQPLKNAKVTVERTGDPTDKKVAFTNSEGELIVGQLDEGSYLITTQATGYKKFEKRELIREKETVYVEAILMVPRNADEKEGTIAGTIKNLHFCYFTLFFLNVQGSYM